MKGGPGGPGDGAGAGGGGPWVVPHPAPDGMPPVHAWGVYADPLRAAVSAWKDAGRRDLLDVLSPLLAHSLDGVLRGCSWQEGVVLVVPAPSSRSAVRQRGDTPMEGLCRAAVAAVAGPSLPALRLAPALRHRRRVEDQSGLGTAERRGNLSGALEVKSLWENVVRGRRCLLVDDVVTTGATLAEAARALRRAGASDVVGACMAATQRTRG
ncbi:ComF family protein [Terrabacter terrae]